MATASEVLQQTFSQIGTDVKQLRGWIGSLTTLTTTEKSNLVGALNELKGRIDGIDVGSIIDDTLTTSTTKTYSIDKIKDTVQASIDALVNGAPTALDTLKELADALSSNDRELATLTTALDNRVSYDSQTKTTAQQAQARANIGALGTGDAIGETQVKAETAKSALGVAIGGTQEEINNAIDKHVGEWGSGTVDFLATYNDAAGN